MKNIYTEKEASEKYCPFNPTISEKCLTTKCMAWVEKYPRVSREDHSGAVASLGKAAMGRNQMYRREGSHGCMGVLILDEQGYCALATREHETEKVEE